MEAGRHALTTTNQTGHPPIDVLFITIKAEELEAVLEVLPTDAAHFPSLWVSPKTERQYNIRTTSSGGGAPYLVAVARTAGRGNLAGLDLARDAIADFGPSLILVVGIAGAPPCDDVSLGDVVISTRILDHTVRANLADGSVQYETSGGPVERRLAQGIANLPARKAQTRGWEDHLPPRPFVDYLDAARYTAGDDNWRASVMDALKQRFGSAGSGAAPRCVDGVVVSTDALMKSPGELIAWLKTARDIRAVDMESAGAYRANSAATGVLAIRGISDVIGFQRDEDWTLYACKSAAAFSIAYLRTQPVPPRNTDSPDVLLPATATNTQGTAALLAAPTGPDLRARQTVPATNEAESEILRLLLQAIAEWSTQAPEAWGDGEPPGFLDLWRGVLAEVRTGKVSTTALAAALEQAQDITLPGNLTLAAKLEQFFVTGDSGARVLTDAQCAHLRRRMRTELERKSAGAIDGLVVGLSNVASRHVLAWVVLGIDQIRAGTKEPRDFADWPEFVGRLSVAFASHPRVVGPQLVGLLVREDRYHVTGGGVRIGYHLDDQMIVALFGGEARLRKLFPCGRGGEWLRSPPAAVLAPLLIEDSPQS